MKVLVSLLATAFFIPVALADSAEFVKPSFAPKTMSRAVQVNSAENDLQSFDNDTRTLSLRGGNTILVDPEGSGSSDGYQGLPGSDPDNDGSMSIIDENAPTDIDSGWVGAGKLEDWKLYEEGPCDFSNMTYVNDAGSGYTYYKRYKIPQLCKYQGRQLYLGSDGKIHGQRTYAYQIGNERIVDIYPHDNTGSQFKSIAEIQSSNACRCPIDLNYHIRLSKNGSHDNDMETVNYTNSYGISNSRSHYYYNIPALYAAAGWGAVPAMDVCGNEALKTKLKMSGDTDAGLDTNSAFTTSMVNGACQ